jgi:drug/metabolite transporter (DMT)-like permease
MYIANFFWYKGLSLGGVANVSQILFLQPLITLFYSAFFWDEEIQVSDYVAIALLLAIIVFSSRNRSIIVKNQ